MGGTECTKAQEISRRVRSGGTSQSGTEPMGTCKMLLDQPAKEEVDVDHAQLEIVDPNKYMTQNKISF
jgi:hypothetical protein